MPNLIRIILVSYTVGGFIAVQNPTWWTTWSNAPGTGEDAYVSGNYAHSPTKSLFIDPNDGFTNLILKLGDKTSGVYNVDWYMYVETGHQAYYNFQHFQVPGALNGLSKYGFFITRPVDSWWEAITTRLRILHRPGSR